MLKKCNPTAKKFPFAESLICLRFQDFHTQKYQSIKAF